jgi:Fe-S cluster assembly protein SufD
MMRRVQRTVRGSLSEKFLVLASGEDDLRVRLTARHDRPDTNSNVSILVLASGNARVAVDATIVIERGAPRTKAWLEIKVVTRGGAVVTAAPNLEIGNNDVRAGHSLKTKHITSEELFYLMSRGLSRDAAEQMIVEALAAPYCDGTVISEHSKTAGSGVSGVQRVGAKQGIIRL